MDSSKKTTDKLSRKIDFKEGLHGRIFLKINTTLYTHVICTHVILAVFFLVY